MAEERRPRNEWEEKLEQLSWAATDHYDVEGFAFALRATDPRFLELIRRYLPGSHVDTERDDVPLFSADCGVQSAMPGGKAVREKLTLYFGTLAIYRGRVRDEMAGRLLRFVREVVNRQTDQFVRFGGGAAVWRDIALLFPTPDPRHTPALVASLLKRGAEYLGDDTMLIDPVLRRVHPSRFPLLLDALDVQLFPELGRETPRRGRDEEELAGTGKRRSPVAAQELGRLADRPSDIGWIVFPFFEDGGETRLEPFGGAEAVFRFAHSRLNLHVWGERGLVLIRDMLETTPVSRLVVGSLPEAVDLVLGFVAKLLQGARA